MPFTGTLDCAAAKRTVKFDEPSVYHLYYGDEVGTPGTVMTHFPFPHIIRGRPGTGEVGTTVFSVPSGTLDFWAGRLAAESVGDIARDESFGQQRLTFRAPEGDGLALVEVADGRACPGRRRRGRRSVRGFHSVSLPADAGATAFSASWATTSRDLRRIRFVRPGSNNAGRRYQDAAGRRQRSGGLSLTSPRRRRPGEATRGAQARTRPAAM